MEQTTGAIHIVIIVHVPPHKPLYHWFDVYDIEEQRL
jgi:hypothetical protein